MSDRLYLVEHILLPGAEHQFGPFAKSLHSTAEGAAKKAHEVMRAFEEISMVHVSDLAVDGERGQGATITWDGRVESADAGLREELQVALWQVRIYA